MISTFIPTSTVELLSFQSTKISSISSAFPKNQIVFTVYSRFCNVKSHFIQAVADKWGVLTFIRKNRKCIFALDMVASLFLDSLLGIFLLRLLINQDFKTLEKGKFVEWAQLSVERLEAMITFMTDTPIGLKLNLPLANFLGQLFLYHLYVWLTWVKLLQPILPVLLYASIFTLILGISTFVNLLFDFFQVMTLHLYCFYLYAVRLYEFTWKSLRHLWLLFRGKKYNPIKKRVDTHEYETDQFLLGSLVFTIFLFLCPTIAVFYFVFACIQFAFSFAMYTVYQIVTAIYQPYLSFICHFILPESFYTALYVVKSNSKSYEFRKKPASFSQIRSYFRSSLPKLFFPVSPIKTVGRWLNNILIGSAIKFLEEPCWRKLQTILPK